MQEEDDNGAPLLVVDAIYDALDRGDPNEALRLARQALDSTDEDDPVLHFLCGVALAELDRTDEAVEQLRQAVTQDPDDGEFRATLARGLFRCCRFDEAESEARRALEGDPELPDAHFVVALLLERGERAPEAEEHFRRAAEIDPERFSLPVRMDRDEFETHVARAIDRLPERFRRHLDQVAVTVEELPSDALLRDGEPPLNPEDLIGLFVGPTLADQGSFGLTTELPPRILLFKRSLERLALELDELAEEIAVTLYHELGHYLGLDEDELVQIDLG